MREKMRDLLKSFFCSWKYKYICKPLLPAICSIAFFIPSIQKVTSSYPITTGYIYLSFCIVLALLATFIFVIEEILGRDNTKLNVEQLSSLLNVIEYPVDKKMNRFLECLKNYTKKGFPDRSNVFFEITKPEEQVAELIRALYIFFEKTIPSDKKLKTLLYTIEDDKINECWCTFPQHSEQGPKVLADDDSLINKVITTKKLIIIEDINKEKKKAAGVARVSRYCETENGSAIAFPIKSPVLGSISMVVAVISEDLFFHEVDKRAYSMILEKIGKRIMVEYALYKLKANAIG